MSASRSKTTSNSDASTQVTTTNQQVGASEGSTAFGANSTVNIESVSDDVVKSAADAIQNVAGKAIEGNVDVSKTVTRDALDFGESALESVARTTESANALLSRTQEAFTSNLARNAGDAPQTVAQDANKNMIIAVVVIALAFAGIQFSKGGSK